MLVGKERCPVGGRSRRTSKLGSANSEVSLECLVIWGVSGHGTVPPDSHLRGLWVRRHLSRLLSEHKDGVSVACAKVKGFLRPPRRLPNSLETPERVSGGVGGCWVCPSPYF